MYRLARLEPALRSLGLLVGLALPPPPLSDLAAFGAVLALGGGGVREGVVAALPRAGAGHGLRVPGPEGVVHGQPRVDALAAGQHHGHGHEVDVHGSLPQLLDLFDELDDAGAWHV